MEKFLIMQQNHILPHKRFYLIRHGESHANRLCYPSGRMDTRLTRRGMEQAHEAAAIIAALADRPEKIVSSTLHRARSTAVIIQNLCACPLEADPALSEQFYGRDQGIHKSKIHAARGPNWWRAPDQGESFYSFRLRIIRCLTWWIHRHDGPLAFVGHSGIFTAIGDVYDTRIRGIPNAGTFLFEPDYAAGRAFWSVFHLKEGGRSDLYCTLGPVKIFSGMDKGIMS